MAAKEVAANCNSNCNSNGNNPDSELSLEMVEEAAACVRKLFPKPDFAPRVAIVCGSGLGGVADLVADPVTIKYSEIPHFPVSTVKGHAGNMLLGQIEGRDVVVMQGRFHPYEGHPYWRAAIYVWVLHQLGVQVLILTNASGGLNRSLHVGQLCLIKDHLDLPGCSGGTPLYGMSDARLFRERFVAMAGAYDRTLRRSLLAAARSLGFGDNVTEGVYAVRSGPNYETPAEGRMLLRMGADVVGMSTVFEAAAARAVGLRVLGLSLVTNLVSLDDESADDPERPAATLSVHAEVIEQSRLQIAKVKAIFTAFIKQLEL